MTNGTLFHAAGAAIQPPGRKGLVAGTVNWAESVAAVILAAEVLLLAASVLARYVFNSPLIWSDELAEILIIWQAMLGAAVAVHRRQHLGLTAIMASASPKVREIAEIACLVLISAFSAFVAYFATTHAWSDREVVTPALEVAAAWRSSAIAVGLALIAVVAVSDLMRRRHLATRRKIAITVVFLGLAVVLYLVRDLFANLGNYNLLIFFLGIGGFCIIIGLPIAFAFGVATVAYVACATTAPPDIIVTRMETGMSHILLLSVPLFILLGSILEIAGMANKLVAFLGAMVGHFKGGLSYVLVGAMVFVSGISGAKAADMAAIAPVLLPEMKRRGVKDSELVGLLASSSAMSETIPPSLILIMTGAVMGISIGALFNAGWLPALVLAGLLCIAARIRARHDTLPATRRASGRAIARLALVALPVLVLPFLIRGAVVEGVATATEVATIGIAYVLIVTLVLYRVFDWRRLFTALKDASILTGVVFLILATANAMAWAFVQSGLSGVLSTLAQDLPGGAPAFLVASILVFIVFGSILEGIPAVVLLGPLLFPIAQAFGISQVHYAIVVILAMGVGLFAPPLGIGFYTACAISRVDPGVAVKSVWTYLAVILIGVIVIAFFPWITIGSK